METPICPVHQVKKYRRYNSTIWTCPKCLKEKNQALLKGSVRHSSKTVIRGSKYAKPKKFNFYTTTAWKWCSHYVLLFYADKNGFVKCATSAVTYHVTDKRMHCGHYIKTLDMTKTNYAVAFDFVNLGPQSLADNRYGGGRQDEMRVWLVSRHGVQAVKDLENRKNGICHLDKAALDYWAGYYKEKFKQLLIERNIKDPWKKMKKSKMKPK